MAIITGASSGIGRAVAQNLNQAGLKFMLSGRRADRLKELKTEGLRMELAKTNIAVACIEPGLVRTEIFREWDEFPAEQFDIPNPLQPEDIARVVRFVLEQPGHIRIPRILAISADQEL